MARYEPSDDPNTPEIAVVVQDDWQGKGVGKSLLSDLLAVAESRGIRRFFAYVLAENRRILGTLARFTEIQERTVESGVVRLAFVRRAASFSG